MTLLSFLPFAAALLSVLLALVSLVRRKRSVSVWCFFAGMLLFGTDSVLTGVSLRASQPADAIDWLTLSFIVKSCVSAVWLCFSLTYSRADSRATFARWRLPFAVIGLLPIALSLGFRDQLLRAVALDTPRHVLQLQFGAAGRVLNVVFLVSLVLILMNLEQTFRSAAGTMRWRIKFVVLGLTVIFGARLYVRIQAILFSAPDLALWGFESGALLIGCVLLAIAYARTGLQEIDVYPSLAVIRSSVTVLIVGCYLFVVGVVAQLVRRFGGAEVLQLQALVLLLGMSGLALLLLSDRARQRLHVFVSRHFTKAQHDSVEIWTQFSQQLAGVQDPAVLSAKSVKLLAETFDVLSATIWLLDDDNGRLVLRASTSRTPRDTSGGAPTEIASAAVITGLAERTSPFDLEEVNEAWAEEFKHLNAATFTSGGNRMCVPLRSGERTMGALVLADRVNGAVYTVEEFELLKCIGDQIAAVLMNLRLADDVARARELEAFRTMSAFFVHDLKNAAASLNLMLKNLPVHFDEPAFREDTLRAIGNTSRRIDQIIARLTALRQHPELIRAEADLNQLVGDALDRVKGRSDAEIATELQPLPLILADRQQIQSVVTNLVLNAGDAVGANGRIQVRTEHREGAVVLSVSDNGCGMSQEFIRDSLFRPFQSTKKQGLGIGLFQSRTIVHAHGGRMQVESEPGKGTTFLVSLPTQGQI